MKNYYEILGVPQSATKEEIKGAYRERAKKLHPDLYENHPLKEAATEEMAKLNEAYERIFEGPKEEKVFENKKTYNNYTKEKDTNYAYTSSNYNSYRKNNYKSEKNKNSHFHNFDIRNPWKMIVIGIVVLIVFVAVTRIASFNYINNVSSETIHYEENYPINEPSYLESIKFGKDYEPGKYVLSISDYNSFQIFNEEGVEIFNSYSTPYTGYSNYNFVWNFNKGDVILGIPKESLIINPYEKPLDETSFTLNPGFYIVGEDFQSGIYRLYSRDQSEIKIIKEEDITFTESYFTEHDNGNDIILNEGDKILINSFENVKFTKIK